MTATAYYNEHDPEKAEVLRHLMREGWIAPGEVDERDIRDVVPAELSGFAQCHFFAGIGLWSVAARRAGIPDHFRLWSGSCPCQPFSAAGAGAGVADPRHLWPHWFWLIAQCRPYAVVGEQSSSSDGLAWLDLVSADMEGSLYAGGALDLCSAGFGAPNIRQRQYMCWVADTRSASGQRRGIQGPGEGDCTGHGTACERPSGFRSTGGLVNSIGAGLEGYPGDGNHGEEPGWHRTQPFGPASQTGPARGMADPNVGGCEPGGLPVRQRRSGEAETVERGHGESDRAGLAPRPVRDPLRGPTNGFWAGADFLLCRDPDRPKLRPVEPGTFCLAAGYPGRTGALRGYGDAINLEVAAAFLETVWPDMRAAA